MNDTASDFTDGEIGSSRGPEVTPDATDDALDRWSIECPEVDATSVLVLDRLHQAFARYQASTRRVLGEFGLSMASFDILTRLRTAGEPYRLSAAELGRSGFVTSGGITQRVDRLVAADLVVRTRNDEDRRYVHVQLTDQGRELVDAAVAPYFADEADMLAGLSVEERATLAVLLKRLLSSMEERGA